MSARNTIEPSYDGLTLTLPKHTVDESDNQYPRWQMPDAPLPGMSPRKMSAGLLGLPPTQLRQSYTTSQSPALPVTLKQYQVHTSTALNENTRRSGYVKDRTSFNNWADEDIGTQPLPRLPASEFDHHQQPPPASHPITAASTWNTNHSSFSTNASAHSHASVPQATGRIVHVSEPGGWVQQQQVGGQSTGATGRPLTAPGTPEPSDTSAYAPSDEDQVRQQPSRSRTKSEMRRPGMLGRMTRDVVSVSDPNLSPYWVSADAVQHGSPQQAVSGVKASPRHAADDVRGAGGEDADALADAVALEEDLAAVMKRLPASLRYGARDGGRDIIASGLVQQLYSRLMRLQALVKRREVEGRELKSQLADAKDQLATSEGTRSLLDTQLSEANHRLVDCEAQLAASLRTTPGPGSALVKQQLHELRLEADEAMQAYENERAARQEIQSRQDQLRAELQRWQHKAEQVMQELQILKVQSGTETITGSADGAPVSGLPVTIVNQWKKALADERAARQQLSGALEVARAELATYKQQGLRHQTVHSNELVEAGNKVQQLEFELKDVHRKVGGLEARLAEAVSEARAARISNDTTAEELTAERETCRRLRLQVTVLQGSIDVLQKALANAREDLKLAREQQAQDVEAAQSLTAELQELRHQASTHSRGSEGLIDKLSRAHLENLMELRNHQLLLSTSICIIPVSTEVSYSRVQQDVRGVSNKSMEELMQGPGLPVLDTIPTEIRSAGKSNTSEMMPSTDMELLPLPEATSPELSLASSRRTSHVGQEVPAVINSAEVDTSVDWHSGLEVLERHLELKSGSSTPPRNSAFSSDLTTGPSLSVVSELPAESSVISQPTASGVFEADLLPLPAVDLPAPVSPTRASPSRSFAQHTALPSPRGSRAASLAATANAAADVIRRLNEARASRSASSASTTRRLTMDETMSARTQHSGDVQAPRPLSSAGGML